MNPGEERTAHLKLEGGLDIYRREQIAALLPDPASVDRVVIDCSDATSIDSTILTLLMRYRRSFAAAGGDAVNIIVIVKPALRRTFDIAGLSRVLTIVSAPARTKPQEEEPSVRREDSQKDAEPT